MKLLKLLSINFLIFFILILLVEIFLGFWFSKNNFGIYMRKERKINWITDIKINNQKYKFSYKRNFWGFRGEEFDPKNVKIIFQGGSTGNQRFTPEELTIVGQLNKRLKKDNIDYLIYNSSTDGKSTNGYINDFLYWFPKIDKLKPKFVIFYIGINDSMVSNEKYWDLKIGKNKFDNFKDYIKNNSFFVDKFKIIKNKYFPRNVLAYDLNSDELYQNFNYINFEIAKKKHIKISPEHDLKINEFEKRLNKLNKIIIEEKFIPIFISQVKFDGLNDGILFHINNNLKKFATNNDYFIIPLDEKVEMKKGDFYDHVHTTPQGSKRIAEILYPNLKKILNEYN